MKKNFIAKIFAASVILLSVLSFSAPAYADVTMMDDFFTVGNNTVPGPVPAKSVDAAPQNIVEYFFRVRNTGDETAKDVQVWAVLPSESSTKLVTTAYIRPNNTDRVNVQISDTATVNVTGGYPVGLRFLAGHTRLAGVTNLFNCPNTCDINDHDILKGIDVGDIPAGQEVQVGFKAFLTQAVTPAPTASPSPSVSPSASPSSPTVVKQVPPTTNTLPNTGIPLAGLALTGLLPAGVGIRKFGKKTVESLSANSLWEDREMKR